MSRMSRTAAAGALLRALRGSLHEGEPGLGERLRSLPRLVRATLSGRYTGTTRARLAMLAGAALYIVSPVDLVPEMVPILGLMDDAVVVAWLAAQLLGETDGFLGWERSGVPGGDRRGPDAGPDVVQGHVVR